MIAPQPNQQIEQLSQGMMQACTDMGTMTRNSLNAALQSATVLTKGADEFCDSTTSLAQNLLTHSINTTKAVMSARSFRDLMDLQTNLMRSGFDVMMAELTRMSEISTRTAQKAMEPVTENISASVMKIGRQKQAA